MDSEEEALSRASLYMINNQVSKCGTTITFLFRILIRYSGIIGAYACRQLYYKYLICCGLYYFISFF